MKDSLVVSSSDARQFICQYVIKEPREGGGMHACMHMCLYNYYYYYYVYAVSMCLGERAKKKVGRLG